MTERRRRRSARWTGVMSHAFSSRLFAPCPSLPWPHPHIHTFFAWHFASRSRVTSRPGVVSLR
eukprot:2960021-Rhodomonas_salina.1